MSRVLVLDDDNTRHKTFARNLIGHEVVVHCRTYHEAADAIGRQEFDTYYLDHDLNLIGENCSVAEDTGRELTGSDFASYVISTLHPDKLPSLVIVHSYNPSGAANIASKFRGTRAETLIVPFGSNSGNESK